MIQQKQKRFFRAQDEKPYQRTLLPSLFSLPWQAHGIHALAPGSNQKRKLMLAEMVSLSECLRFSSCE